MKHDLTRRDWFRLGAAAFGAALPWTRAAQAQPPVPAYDKPARVALVHGDDRRKIVFEALKAIEPEIAPALRAKKYVLIKPNNVSTRNPLACTHVDTLRAILDFVEPYKKPVVIAESSAYNTFEAYENFGYTVLPNEYKRLGVKLVDLNTEGLFEVIYVLDGDLHPVPVRLAKRLLDPDAFILCSAVLKTHNTVVATLSVKNMTLGAPLRSAPKDPQRWNDKRNYHGGVRQTHYDMFLTAQKLRPYWGAAVIDGFEGMEGNGPSSGTPVNHRIAIASTDYIAADRVGIEVMGINPDWLGYLIYCHQAGLGQYDLSKITIVGDPVEKVRRKYVLHQDIERQLMWMGPMEELPPKLG